MSLENDLEIWMSGKEDDEEMTLNKALQILKMENDLMIFDAISGESDNPEYLDDVEKSRYYAHEFLLNYFGIRYEH